jgi:hypothetical protein
VESDTGGVFPIIRLLTFFEVGGDDGIVQTGLTALGQLSLSHVARNCKGSKGE